MILCMNYKSVTVQKIDVSEGIDVNKSSASKECELCCYWFFKDIGFKFEEHVCNICHDFPMDTSSLICHRFDVEIPHGKLVEITSILKGEST